MVARASNDRVRKTSTFEIGEKRRLKKSGIRPHSTDSEISRQGGAEFDEKLLDPSRRSGVSAPEPAMQNLAGRGSHCKQWMM